MKPRARQLTPKPVTVTLAEFARRKHCDRQTILRNYDLMHHATKEAGRWTWAAEFVDAHSASLPQSVDRNQYPHTRADVARLVGVKARTLERWGGGMEDPLGSPQRLYSDADLRRFIIQSGKIGLEAVCWFLQTRDSSHNPVVLLINRGHLHRPDTVDRITGEWLWLDPARVLARCDYLLAWINQGNAGALRQDLADCCDWETVSGMEDLERWTLEETDGVQSAWLERSRSEAAKAERKRLKAAQEAEERRQWLVDAPKREAEHAARRKRLEEQAVKAAAEKAQRYAEYETQRKAELAEVVARVAAL